MQYRTIPDGTAISVLGFGCMRFTKAGGRIDLDKAERELMAAIDAGVNYLDTAYIYPGSEEALGEILERAGRRDDVLIADKLPGYLVKSAKAFDKYLNEQLRRLRTDHIDFYLIHMLADVTAWEKLKSLGIEEWLERKRVEGAIRRVGFSFHGDTATFKPLIDAYPWDFCQIQYNYLDENAQAGRKGLTYAAERDIPVIIMEPLRGGSLVNDLPDEARAAFEAHEPQRTPAAWAFSWLYDQPEVTCVLSGMNSLPMVEENVHTASNVTPGSLTEADHALFNQVCEAINRNTLVPCTGCGYCMPCPRGVDIPTAFRCYNKTAQGSKMNTRREYLQITSFKIDASNTTACTQCGACARHCPQHIDIPTQLKAAEKTLLPWYMKITLKGMHAFMK